MQMDDNGINKPEESNDKFKDASPEVKPTEKGIGRSLRNTLSKHFSTVTVPIEKPTIADDFHDLSVLQRVTESIRYNVFCLEYFLSPKGGLRQWIKINVSLLLLFGIPILFFVPLVTYLMSGLATMSELLLDMSGFLLDASLNFLYFLICFLQLGCITYSCLIVVWVLNLSFLLPPFVFDTLIICLYEKYVKKKHTFF